MREEGEFKLVVGRKKRVARGRSSSHSMPCLLANDEDDDKSNADRRTLLGKLREAEVRLRDSSFADNFFHSLEDSLIALNATGIADLVCYGLGNFSTHRSSKYQLALLLCLKRRYGSRMYAYDPIFSPQEVELLRELGCQPIERNEEGKRIIGENVTLVYMPHCSTRLTNNFLYANWGEKLNKCILLTNSFSVVLDDRRKMNGSDPVDYISRVRPYVTEIALRNDFPYEEAFNDSHIHIFLKRDIDAIPPSFWNEREEPRYPDVETDFFTAQQTEFANASTRKYISRITVRIKMKGNWNVVRSLVQEIRRASPGTNRKDNAMVEYVLEQARAHRETSQVLCKAREELRNLAETYLCYLNSQRVCKEIQVRYTGKGERSVKETADLVGFKLPHDPK